MVEFKTYNSYRFAKNGALMGLFIHLALFLLQILMHFKYKDEVLSDINLIDFLFSSPFFLCVIIFLLCFIIFSLISKSFSPKTLTINEKEIIIYDKRKQTSINNNDIVSFNFRSSIILTQKHKIKFPFLLIKHRSVFLQYVKEKFKENIPKKDFKLINRLIKPDNYRRSMVKAIVPDVSFIILYTYTYFLIFFPKIESLKNLSFEIKFFLPSSILIFILFIWIKRYRNIITNLNGKNEQYTDQEMPYILKLHFIGFILWAILLAGLIIVL